MRLFIAANIPDKIKDEFEQLNKGLKYKLPNINWTTGRNFHITIKFLGDVKEGEMPHISTVISDICKDIKPFAVHFEGLGAFPDARFIRVVWAGIKEGKSELEDIAKKLDCELEKNGFEKERRSFKAHLTIGKVRSPGVKNISFEGNKSDFGSFELTKIDLMQSILKPNEAEHIIVGSFQFGGKTS